MSELLDRLRGALGPAYVIEKELGGGGMSRVFLAEEVALHRRVVIKVLPPEMGAGVNAERFQREVQLAASLQHPHVVPVLSAGANQDLRYYIMPFVAGESLRRRLAREHELPVPEVIQILRDVLDGLAAAHEQGVVHRDIKPDNILLSGRHAVITDFGVSKAVSESTTGTSLTSLGIALGTPAYMAPEQAAGDPQIDQRADLYAIGVLAYEMLCGRTPFQTTTPQQMLSAQIVQRPEPCTTYRASVPEALNAMVMRCLEKKAADRPQSAEELLTGLIQISTPSGSMSPEASVVSTGTLAAIARHHPLRLALLSAAAPLTLLAVVLGLVRFVGLPLWAVTGAMAILGLSVPLLYLTGRAERRRLLNRAEGTGPVTGPLRHFTWHRALAWGGGALCALALVTAAFMAMRAYGIGPAGTLLGKGLYTARDPVLVLDFENHTADSTLGLSVTELVRIDLDQSEVVSLFQPQALRAALERMQVPATAKLTPDIARELAQRENIKALVEGDISAVGGSLVVSLRLIAPASGEVMVARRETAAGTADLIAAVDRLSSGLRERIGESLRRLQREPPIAAVTTPSFEAFRAYAMATSAYNVGDVQRALDLLRKATTIDTAFADAYRRMGVYFWNEGFPRDSLVRAMTRAYQLRDRLPAVEHALVEATYHNTVTEQYEDAVAAYLSVLALQPDHGTAIHNLSLLYLRLRRFALAESLQAANCARATPGNAGGCSTLADAHAYRGRYAEAREAVDRAESLGPKHPLDVALRANLALAEGRYDEAGRIMEPVIQRWRDAGTSGSAAQASYWATALAFLHGQIAEARQQRSTWARARRAINPGFWPEELSEAFFSLQDDVYFERDTRRSRETLVAALEKAALEQRDPENRGYALIAVILAQSGDAALARAYAVRYETEVTEVGPQTRRAQLDWMWGHIALASGQGLEGIQRLRAWEQDTQDPLNAMWLAWAYDRAGQRDSAEAVYRRFLETPSPNTVDFCAWIPRALRRVGELAEARGATAEAKRFYERFLELWANADSEAQPIVGEVRQRVARL